MGGNEFRELPVPMARASKKHSNDDAALRLVEATNTGTTNPDNSRAETKLRSLSEQSSQASVGVLVDKVAPKPKAYSKPQQVPAAFESRPTVNV